MAPGATSDGDRRPLIIVNTATPETEISRQSLSQSRFLRGIPVSYCPSMLGINVAEHLIERSEGA